MSQADKIFRKAFSRHFTNHECNYPPTRQIALGDFGEMRNGYFSRLGNIRDTFGIDFKTLDDDHPSYEEFKSEGDVGVTFYAKGDVKPGGVPVVRGQVDFSFSSKNAFYFSSAEVTYLQIRDLLEVGERIKQLYDEGKWRKKFVLVSTLLQAGRAIVIISGSSNAGLTIEASGDVPNINLADVSTKLEVKTSSSVSYQIITPGTCQIGFGLSRIYNPLFHRPDFKSAERMADTFARLDYDRDGAVVFGNIMVQDDMDEIA